MDKQGYKGIRVTEYALLAAAALLCVFKHSLVTSLPVEARYYVTDDFLMVQMAEGLLSGNWLGAYDPVILMKGAFFPLFLAASNRFGSSYLSTLDFMNTLACVYFVWQMRHLFRDRRLLFPLFVVLLFEPCTFSGRTFQRVYRSSLTWMQVLFLFGSYFGLYLRGKEHLKTGRWTQPGRDVILFLVAGFSLWAMWNSREESSWVIPFVLVATVLLLIDLLGALRTQKDARAAIGMRLLCCLLPFLILFGGNQWIRWENARHYGVSLRLEEVDGEFAETLKTIYSIKNETDIPYVTVSREKLERLYAASPSLQSIQPEVEAQMDRFAGADRNRLDREVEDGWFFWGLKRAAFDNGVADTLPKSQQFWKQVRVELEEALASPNSGLERQPVMPSALMSPWRSEFLSEIPGAFTDGLKYLVTFKGVGPSFELESYTGQYITRRFELVTNNLSVYAPSQAPLDEHLHASLVYPSFAVLERIVRIYQVLNRYVLLVSLPAYLVFVPVCAVKKRSIHVPFILIILGMVLSALVMFAGVIYTDISAFPAVNKFFYMNGIYPLMLSCEWLTILYLSEQILLSRRAPHTIRERASGA